jgi:uncharacterized protein
MPDRTLMICVDVNILIHAANIVSPRHSSVRAWLAAVLASREPLVIPDAVATGFLRIVTNRRIMPSPLHPDEALALVDWLLDHPRVTPHSGDDVTRIAFRDLVRSLGLRGNDIPDAWIAASAMSTHATLATFDRGFRRFPGLRVIEPSD